MSGDNPQPEPTTDNDAARRHIVQVKSEYVLSERPPCLAPPQETPSVAAAGDAIPNITTDLGNGNTNGRNNKNKTRGQNTKRPRDSKIDFGDKACLAVVRGEVCPFLQTAKGCRYNHDLKELLANRPADLNEGEGGAEWLKNECPFWKSRGYCNFGIMCRLGTCHLNMSTGQNLCRVIDDSGNESICLPSSLANIDELATTDTITFTDAEPQQPKPQKLNQQSEIKNILSKDTQIKLRKNKYPFVCKRHFEQKNDKTSKPPQENIQSTNVPALPPKERKLIDFRNKVYVAPLTTVGNLPFRRIMKHYGADITCGEMALVDQLLMGKPSEWALLKRHPCEDVFGVQIASGHADQFTRLAEILSNEESMEIDFVDMNLGCPIDLVCDKGAGAALMLREKKLRGSLEGMLNVLNCPVTIKMRTGWSEGNPIAHELVPRIQSWNIDGIGAIMIHGRSRLQRYSRLANWEYISQVASGQSTDLPQIPLIGNGDIFSYTDYEDKILKRVNNESDDGNDSKNNLLPTAMLGRGALIKPWLPTEIKERRHWDISASERFDMLKDFVRFGLEHWGSDQQGVNQTRRFLLEWISFLHRYVPVGLLEVIPQRMNHRPPLHMCGRSDLETLMLSKHCADWIKISTMLLGPVPDGFQFEPKHKANSYQ